jgi:CBS domain-containing protein
MRMFCRDVMHTGVQTCHPSDTVARCANIMAEHDVGFVPVVDARGRPVGVVTDRDIVLRVLAEKRPARTHVSRIMSEGVISCRIEETLESAEDKLAQFQKSRIVVVDEEGRVSGVISLSDIGQVEGAERAGELLRAVSGRDVPSSDEAPTVRRGALRLEERLDPT